MIRKVYGNAIVLAAAAGRRGIAYAPAEHIARLRDARIRRLVHYAASTVPYYRDYFRDEGVDPGEIRNAADLARLPLLEKATVSADPARFRSESHHGRRALKFKTSGSTGLPLDIWHDRRSILENIAYSEPERAVATGIIGRGTGYRSFRVNRASSTLGEVQAFCARNTLIPGKPQHLRIDVNEPPEAVVERIRELRPEIFGGYGAYLEMFFRYLYENQVSIPMPRLVNYGAEGMTMPGRRLITEAFGIPVIASYNAVESFKVGFQCGHGPDYHVHGDLCHLRIVDTAGNDVEEGKPGEVVITNLVNRGTVLLNYRLGDRAALTSTPCECGRTFRRLTGLEGRVLDAIVRPGGSFIHAGAIWSVLAQGRGVVRYQFIQDELERFSVKLVTVDDGSFDRFRRDVLPELRSLLGASARIEISRHDEIPPDASGKFRPIRSRCGIGSTS